MIQHLCKSCGNSFTRYNTLQNRCPTCLTKQSKTNKDKVHRRRVKRIGRVTQDWLDFRTEYLDSHPEPYYCIVGSGKMDRKHVTLDHDIPRSKRPDLRTDESNIHAMCGFHNKDKGSRSLEEYIASKPDMRCRSY